MGAQASTAQIESLTVTTCGGRHIIWLTKALASPDITIQRSAARTLERLCQAHRIRERLAHQAEAIPNLLNIIANIHSSSQLLIDALGTLSWILEFPIAREQLAAIPNALPKLIRLCEKPSLHIQKNAVKALGWALHSAEFLDKLVEGRRGIIVLSSLLRFQHQSVRKEAIIALQRALTSDAVLKILAEESSSAMIVQGLSNCMLEEKLCRSAAIAMALALRSEPLREQFAADRESVGHLFSLLHQTDENLKEVAISMLGWAFRVEGVRALFAEELDGIHLLVHGLKSPSQSTCREVARTLGWAFRSKILRENFAEEKEAIADLLKLLSEPDSKEDTIVCVINSLGWAFRSERLRQQFIDNFGFEAIVPLLNNSQPETVRKSAAVALQWGFDNEDLRDKFVDNKHAMDSLISLLDVDLSPSLIKTGTVTLGCLLRQCDIDSLAEEVQQAIENTLTESLHGLSSDEILREVLVALGWSFRSENMCVQFLKDERNVEKVVYLLTKENASLAMVRSAASNVGCGLVWPEFRKAIEEHLDVVSALSDLVDVNKGTDVLKAAVTSLSCGFVSESFKNKYASQPDALQKMFNLLVTVPDESVVACVLEACIIGNFVQECICYENKKHVFDQAYSLVNSTNIEFRKAGTAFIGECLAFNILEFEDCEKFWCPVFSDEGLFMNDLWESSPRIWILSSARMVLAMETVRRPECNDNVRSWNLWNMSEFWDTVGSMLGESRYLEKVVKFVVWYQERDVEEEVSLRCFDEYRADLRDVCVAIPKVLSTSSSFLWRLGWIENMLENTVFVISIVGPPSSGKTALLRSMFGEVGVPEQFFSTYGIPCKIDLNAGTEKRRYFVHFKLGLDWEGGLIPEILKEKGFRGVVEKMELDEYEVHDALFLKTTDGPEEEQRKREFAQFIKYIEIHTTGRKVPLLVYEVPEDREEILDEIAKFTDICLFTVESRKALDSGVRLKIKDLREKQRGREIIVAVTKWDEVLGDAVQAEEMARRFLSAEISPEHLFVVSSKDAGNAIKKLRKNLERIVLNDQDGFAMLDEVCLHLYREFFDPYWTEVICPAKLTETSPEVKERSENVLKELKEQVEAILRNAIRSLQNDILPKFRVICESRLRNSEVLELETLEDRQAVLDWVSEVEKLRNDLRFAITHKINEISEKSHESLLAVRSNLLSRLQIESLRNKKKFSNGLDQLAQKVRHSVWLQDLDVLYEKVLMEKDTMAQVNTAITQAVVAFEDVLHSRLVSVLCSEIWSESVKWLAMIQEYVKLILRNREKNIVSKINYKYLALRSKLDSIAEALTRVDDDDAQVVQSSGKEWLVQVYNCKNFIEEKFPELEIPEPGVSDTPQLAVEWEKLKDKLEGDVAAAQEKFNRPVVVLGEILPKEEKGKTLETLFADSLSMDVDPEKTFAQVRQFGARRLSVIECEEEKDLNYIRFCLLCCCLCKGVNAISEEAGVSIDEKNDIVLHKDSKWFAIYEFNGQLIVAFRGEWDVADAICGTSSSFFYPEALVGDDRFVSCMSLHSGVVDLCKEFEEELAQILSILSPSRERSVTFTGHSIGGGMALSIALRFLDRNIIDRNFFQVLSFGAPLIVDGGGSSWNDLMNDHDWDAKVRCFVNSWDIVPRTLGNREGAGVAGFIRNEHGGALGLRMVSDRYVPLGRYAWIRDDCKVMNCLSQAQRDFVLIPQPLAASRLFSDHRRTEYTRKMRTFLGSPLSSRLTPTMPLLGVSPNYDPSALKHTSDFIEP